MANIKVNLGGPPVNGQPITFRSPASCAAVTGLIVYYPNGSTTSSKVFQFVDAHGNNVAGKDLFASNVLVKVILDTELNRAYVQNADTNAYLEHRFENIDTDQIKTGAMPIERGGTGATTSADARTNLNITPETIGALAKEDGLSTAVASLFGFGEGAVPNDLFSWLSQFNKHTWVRKATTVVWEAVEYKASGADHVCKSQESSTLCTLQYADSIQVSQSNGAISLVNPKSISFSYDTFYDNNVPQTINYKYVKWGNKIYRGNWGRTTRTETVTMVLTDGSVVQEDRFYYVVAIYSGYSYFQGESFAADDTWSVITSDSKDTYPESGVSGSFEYKYIGVPFNNLQTQAPVRVDHGTYVGTGTSGQSNKNTLAFSFVPKIVFLNKTSDNSVWKWSMHQPFMYGIADVRVIEGNSNTDCKIKDGGTIFLTWEGKVLSWYSSNSDLQYNEKNVEYTYVAIG